MKLELLARTEIGQKILLVGILIPFILMTIPQSTQGAQVVRTTDVPTFEIKIGSFKLNQNFTAPVTLAAANLTTVKEDAPVEVQAPVDPLAERKQLIREYLEKRGPLFAPYADVIAESENWRRILAITAAESGFKYGKYNNYWGIGGSKLRRYETIGHGIKDLDRLLSKPLYAGKTLNQMCGVYVQPCTQTWLKNTGSIYNAVAHIK